MDATITSNLVTRAHSLGVRARRVGRRAPRWLRIVVIALVGLYVHYLGLGNLFVRTRAMRAVLSRDESHLKVEYASAWTAYPGHLAVRGLWLRYQDRSVQMLIELERVTMQLELRALLRRTIRFRNVDAEGATFRLRNKLTSLEGNEGRVRAFPPIEGFADPPLEPPFTRAPIPDDEYKLWTIELAEVSGSLRDVWMMEVRYQGDGSVTGGFHLKPLRDVWVLPAVMVTRGGVFSFGERELVRGGESRLEVRLDSTDVREPPAIADVLRNVTARIHQRGELASLGAIGATYLPGSRVVLDEGAGPIAIDVSLERGVVQADSRVTYHSDAATLKVPGLGVRGDVDVIARVAVTGGHAAIVAESTTAQARVTPAAELRGVRLAFELGGADLAAPLALARAAGSLESAHIGDLRAWRGVMPDGASLDGGAATFAARAALVGDALEGRLDASFEGAKVTVGTSAFAFSGKASTDLASEDVHRALAFPGAKLDLHDGALRLEGGHAEGLWLRARLTKASATTEGPLRADADLRVEAGPGDRTVKLFTRMASLPDIAADATAGAELTAALHLAVRPHEITLTVQDAHNGALEVRGRARKRQHTALTGAFLLKVGPFSSGLDLHDGDVSVVPLVGGPWLDEKLRSR